MPNQNCLKGLRCPLCGEEEPFQISCTTMVDMWDGGSEQHYDLEWNDDSAIICKQCGHCGEVKEFMIANQEGSDA